MKKTLIVSLIAVSMMAIGADAKRPYYGGGHHTKSHGGHYQNGQRSSHKGGHYRNSATDNQYGIHKPSN